MREYLHHLKIFLSIFFLSISFFPISLLPFRGFASSNIANTSALDFAYVVDEQQYFKNERIDGLKKIFWELQTRTSIVINIEPTVFTFSNSAKPEITKVLSHPFVIWTSLEAFSLLSTEEKKLIKEFVFYGGTLFFDNTHEDEKIFSQALSSFLNDIAPEQNLFSLPKEHVFFKSFYLIGELGGSITSKWGRFDFSRHLLAIDTGGKIGIFYSRNDLTGALTFTKEGNPAFLERSDHQKIETSYRYFTNLIMYSLCLDYKDDQVHIPFILKRRR